MKSLLCIGDSLTAGYGIAKKASWTTLLSTEFSFQIINKGVNGDTTSGMLSRSHADVILTKPSAVIIMGGTNDLFSGFPVQYIYENLIFLAKEAASNSIIPILASPPPVNVSMAERLWASGPDYKVINSRLSELNKLLEGYCMANNLTLLSLNKVFQQAITPETENQYYTDGLHLSIKGNRLIFEAVKELIERNLL